MAMLSTLYGFEHSTDKADFTDFPEG